MFGEPPRSEYDLHFRVLDVPVRVHPFFWLLTIFLGINNTGRGIFIWVGVVFVSILVHELGHALAIRFYGWTPRIVLHSFGGLAIYDPSSSPWQSGRRIRRTPAMQIMISLAGPVAGFVLAALVVAVLFLTQSEIGFYFFGRLLRFGAGNPITNPDLANFVLDLLYVNIFWGLLNLLPIFPLDGGQVARELFVANSNDGIRQSLQLSFATAAVIALLALVQYQQTYMALMFGYMAYINYQQLSGPSSFGGRW